MKKRISQNYFFIVLLLFMFTQCADELDMPAYVKYFNKKDNGLYADVQQDSLLFSVAIKSREYMALINIGPEAMEMSTQQLRAEIENTEDFTYIFFKAKNDGRIIQLDSISVIAQINYFQTGILNDAFLINEQESISPVMSTYVPSNNLTNEHTIILAFPVAFNKISEKPVFKLNRSKYFLKDITITLNKFKGNKIPKLTL